MSEVIETVAQYRKRLRRNALRFFFGAYILVVAPFLVGYFRDPSGGLGDVGVITFSYSFMAVMAYVLMSLVSPPKPPQNPAVLDDIGISSE